MQNIDYLLELAKVSLRINKDQTAVDDEIKTYIYSAIEDIKRVGVEVDEENPLQQSYILIYVKSFFGYTDYRDKERNERARNSILMDLRSSYQKEE